MRLKNWIAGIALAGLVFVSCNVLNEEPEPVVSACFTTSVDEGKVGETIEFSNCSEEATSFTWDFGDGNTSTVREPTHTYDEAGNYEIILFAGNDLNADGVLNTADDAKSVSKKLEVIPNIKSIELTIKDASSWTLENSSLDLVEGAVAELFASQEAFDADTPTYTVMSDESGLTIFYDLPGDTYFLIVKKGNLGNISLSGYIFDGVFQTQEEIDNSAQHPNNPVPGSVRYKDVNGDGKINSEDHASYDEIWLDHGIAFPREIVIGKE